MISAQEAREGAAFAESILKWLTGGDRVRARRLHENSSEFDPTLQDLVGDQSQASDQRHRPSNLEPHQARALRGELRRP